eukprot:gene20862-27699_t
MRAVGNITRTSSPRPFYASNKLTGSGTQTAAGNYDAAAHKTIRFEVNQPSTSVGWPSTPRQDRASTPTRASRGPSMAAGLLLREHSTPSGRSILDRSGPGDSRGVGEGNRRPAAGGASPRERAGGVSTSTPREGQRPASPRPAWGAGTGGGGRPSSPAPTARAGGAYMPGTPRGSRPSSPALAIRSGGLSGVGGGSRDGGVGGGNGVGGGSGVGGGNRHASPASAMQAGNTFRVGGEGSRPFSTAPAPPAGGSFGVRGASRPSSPAPARRAVGLSWVGGGSGVRGGSITFSPEPATQTGGSYSAEIVVPRGGSRPSSPAPCQGAAQHGMRQQGSSRPSSPSPFKRGYSTDGIRTASSPLRPDSKKTDPRSTRGGFESPARIGTSGPDASGRRVSPPRNDIAAAALTLPKSSATQERETRLWLDSMGLATLAHEVEAPFQDNPYR